MKKAIINIIRLLFAISSFCIFSLSYAEPFIAISSAEQLKHNNAGLLIVAADWCSTCIEQKKILTKLSLQDKYKSIKLYSINFDTQKALLKNFNASMQSTLIAYKNGREIERVTGETKVESIQKILDKLI